MSRPGLFVVARPSDELIPSLLYLVSVRSPSDAATAQGTIRSCGCASIRAATLNMGSKAIETTLTASAAGTTGRSELPMLSSTSSVPGGSSMGAYAPCAHTPFSTNASALKEKPTIPMPREWRRGCNKTAT